MNILRKAGTTAALSVAGVGIAVGGVGLAGADDTTTEQDSSSTGSAEPGEARGPGHGPGGRDGRRGAGQLGSGLAEALGLEQSDVAAAMRAVHESAESAEGEERTRPTEAERAARQGELAAALADELGISEQKVTAALDSLTAERAAAGRSQLAERLDAAVADGTLTAADKRAVLKAYDAGVLGGGGRGHGPSTG